MQNKRPSVTEGLLFCMQAKMHSVLEEANYCGANETTAKELSQIPVRCIQIRQQSGLASTLCPENTEKQNPT